MLNGKVLLTWENGSVQITFRPESSTFKVKRTARVYPPVRVDSSGCQAVGLAGGVLLTRTVDVSGLGAGLSAGLSRWRRPLAVHDPGKILTDLAVSLALGGDCLADIALLRSEAGVYGRVASDPTVSRLIGLLAADAPAAWERSTRPGRTPGPGCGHWPGTTALSMAAARLIR